MLPFLYFLSSSCLSETTTLACRSTMHSQSRKEIAHWPSPHGIVLPQRRYVCSQKISYIGSPCYTEPRVVGARLTTARLSLPLVSRKVLADDHIVYPFGTSGGISDDKKVMIAASTTACLAGDIYIYRSNRTTVVRWMKTRSVRSPTLESGSVNCSFRPQA